MATTKMSLKLLLDTKANRVIFAEAGKDFVDFLFSLLSLPVGAVIKLLAGRSSVSCIGNVYQSFGNLNESYMQPNLSKDILLNPDVSASGTAIPLMITASDSTITKKFYICGTCNLYVANVSNFACPRCKVSLLAKKKESCKVSPRKKKSSKISRYERELTYVEKDSEATPTGYVQGLVMYMVSDDLSVMPMSMVSSIKLMNKWNISQLNVLEERVVQVGMDEGLELLKASFQSEATLTAVFLGKKGDSIVKSSGPTE